ncbi:MAG: hypothetical protein PVI30_28175, partial [Myxococcales bacterium]
RAGACSIFQTLPTPTCNDDDFAPNQGFAAECHPEEPEEAAMNAADAGPAAGPEPRDPPTDDPATMNRSKTGGGLCSASGAGASHGRPPGHAPLLAWIIASLWAGFRRGRAGWTCICLSLLVGLGCGVGDNDAGTTDGGMGRTDAGIAEGNRPRSIGNGVDGDGALDFAPVADLHVGVVSTDLGAPVVGATARRPGRPGHAHAL